MDEFLIKCRDGVIYPLGGFYRYKKDNRGHYFYFFDLGNCITIKKQCRVHSYLYLLLEFPHDIQIRLSDDTVFEKLGELASRGYKVHGID